MSDLRSLERRVMSGWESRERYLLELARGGFHHIGVDGWLRLGGTWIRRVGPGTENFCVMSGANRTYWSLNRKKVYTGVESRPTVRELADALRVSRELERYGWVDAGVYAVQLKVCLADYTSTATPILNYVGEDGLCSDEIAQDVLSVSLADACDLFEVAGLRVCGQLGGEDAVVGLRREHAKDGSGHEMILYAHTTRPLQNLISIERN